jgi:acetyl esterase
MSLDPQCQEILDYVRARETVPLHTLTPEEARRLRRLPFEPGPELFNVENLEIPAERRSIPVRIYTPAEGGPYPVLIWFHGGGWVMGSIDMADNTCRHLALRAGCLVASVGYRLAPESKYPAAVEDAYAATRWIVENADRINGINHLVAVGGESSGGNLAAAVALMARDRHVLRLIFQLLVYPVIEPNFSTESYQQNGKRFGPSAEMMHWFWQHYLGNERDALDPYASPMRAESLKGLPPALVITAEFDALRDEGEAYGKRLKEAGVPTTLSRYDGMIHLFFLLANKIDKGQLALDEAAEALKAAFQK